MASGCGTRLSVPCGSTDYFSWLHAQAAQATDAVAPASSITHSVAEVAVTFAALVGQQADVVESVVRTIT